MLNLKNEETKIRWVLVIIGWALLFMPRIFPAVTTRNIFWMAVSAAFLWPMIFRRWSRWSLVAAIMLIGVLDIFYVYHFRALVDEFFVATISRTNT